ncbi:MAG: cell division protein FtsQ/DivIB [Rhodobacteraceae bacterium]|nr:cell division protein FtsQ/DivIB [Paracoccaceae bacterium]
MQPLAAPASARRDPAPSRAAYRLHRLWLTPLFRTLVRVGLPGFALAFGVGLWLSDPARNAALAERLAAMVQEIRQRPEFLVRGMEVVGASGPVQAALPAVLDITFPASSLALDLEALRARIEAIDVVRSAELRIRPGGILEVAVTERVPVLVWRSRAGLDLLDETGHRVAGILDREARADLPLVVGDGADRAVPEAIALLAAAGPLGERLRGLVRMGERRWDLVLDRDQRILLPETGAPAALERALALQSSEDLLGRDIAVVDLRLDRRPTLRLTTAALAELGRIREASLAGDSR